MSATVYTAVNSLSSATKVTSFSHNKSENELIILRDGGLIHGKKPSSVYFEEPLPGTAKHILERGDWLYNQIHSVSLPKGRLVAGQIPVSQNGDLYYDLAMHEGQHIMHPSVTRASNGQMFASLNLESKRKVAKSAALLFFSPASGSNHSHWLLQTLPKIQWLKDAGVEPDIFLVRNTIQPYQIDTLAALGISKDRLETVWHYEEVEFDHLYALYTINAISPDLRIYDQLIDIVPHNKAGPERIYVSRQDARRIRRFLNEEAIIEVVKKHGFEIITPSQLSFEDEVRKFRDARIVVGPVGAGLYNTLFTKPGAKILALSESAYVMDWPLQLATLRNHDLSYLLGNSFLSMEPVYNGTHNSWVLDPQILDQTLKNML